MVERGIQGKILNVHLGTRKIEPESLPEEMYRRYLGGYGLGARLLFDRVPVTADPLGPDNILGLMPGVLTGTPLFGIRFQAVGKTPKTGGWGDSNCGGDFGPVLKHSGWDGLFCSGMADKPVYLLIEDEKAELRDASDLWGMDAIAVEKELKVRHGKKASVACIGPAGEICSHMAGICNEHGRLAGRSGLGGVMGSKKLKAVVSVASRKILAQDKDVLALVKTSIDELGPMAMFFRTYGTTGITSVSAMSGDSPVKNWGGAGVVDFLQAQDLKGDNFNAKMKRSYACWHCPIACGAESYASENPQYPYPEDTHRAEYETACAFGTSTLTGDIDYLQYANHLCNVYGLDTIAAGATTAFAVECFENGLITKEDTDGLELRWGNGPAMIEFLHKIVKREGVGELFADGVRKAAEKIGPQSDPFAMDIAGEELPMHDAKLQAEYFATYKLDPTPARHTLYNGRPTDPWGVPAPPSNPRQAEGRGPHHKGASEYMHVVNSVGVCMFISFGGPNHRIPEWVNAVTGWDTDLPEMLKTGERIANMRMAFHVLHGDNPVKRRVPGRLVGKPPLEAGPHSGYTMDTEVLEREFLEACDWDRETCYPSRAKLEELGLKDVADVLYAK